MLVKLTREKLTREKAKRVTYDAAGARVGGTNPYVFDHYATVHQVSIIALLQQDVETHIRNTVFPTPTCA